MLQGENVGLFHGFVSRGPDRIIYSLEIPSVVDRARTLFAGHPDLIEGLKLFLPPEYSRKSLEDILKDMKLS